MLDLSRYIKTNTDLPMLRAKPSQKFRQNLAAISVSLGAFCAGTVLSWTSPALSHILVNQTNSTETSPGFTVTQNEAALVGATLTVGALISAIPIGYLADRIGRKPTILILAVMFLINWILISFSACLEMVIIARFFAGVSLGGICVAAPMYIGEIAEASNRGMFGSFFQLFLSSGILFTCIIGYFTNWLGLGLVLGVTPFLFGVSFFFMPETPTYLLKRNRIEEAEENLKKLRGDTYDVASELKNMQKDIIESLKSSVGVTDIFTSKANLKSLASVIGVLAFQQFSGINAIIFYTVTIFQSTGTDISPFLSAIIVNLVQVIVSYISILIIEKANRRFYLMSSSSGMMVCLVALGMYFHLKLLNMNITHLSLLPLASTILYMVCFSFGYGPVPWMLLGELFSPEIKGVASGISILANWIFAFVVTFSFPILNESLGSHVAFYILANIMGVATVFVYFVVPETRGKTLQQIQEELKM